MLRENNAFTVTDKLKATRQIINLVTLKKDRPTGHKSYVIAMVLIIFSPKSRSFVILLEWNLFCLALGNIV
jgi:hypothetical protein